MYIQNPLLVLSGTVSDADAKCIISDLNKVPTYIERIEIKTGTVVPKTFLKHLLIAIIDQLSESKIIQLDIKDVHFHQSVHHGLSRFFKNPKIEVLSDKLHRGVAAQFEQQIEQAEREFCDAIQVNFKDKILHPDHSLSPVINSLLNKPIPAALRMNQTRKEIDRFEISYKPAPTHATSDKRPMN